MTSDRGLAWHERSLGYLMAVYLGLVIALITATLLIAYIFSLQSDRVFFVVGGGFTLVGTWWRPWWFWEHPKAHFIRGLIGEAGTTLVYTAVGLGMIYIGLFTSIGIFH